MQVGHDTVRKKNRRGLSCSTAVRYKDLTALTKDLVSLMKDPIILPKGGVSYVPACTRIQI